MIDLDTVAEFTYGFGQLFLLKVKGKFYVWSDPDYEGGDNTIGEYTGNPSNFAGPNFMGRYKGIHRIGDYCGELVKFV